ncbi:MAG: hypothetical protein COU82_02185 [Candidatus Portnoybacteria bacterium CG10_big_fil_rev_8_21_14_0_10_38_18]|uniref:Uncharacterized protein n=1 Tax=Candidatus Portnoybacteria bacterium CG10_big_fil_rev_8_21_14_0_10_38_18 TaxID=1974813 RepID=A0A2M8KBW1_9BACT|nr:MAG: hypothetical protein COU82_02185 [Candidatus Portnoybacteria bacterium CG10_big_fil_rev_8_21_14_0_10_38_18]
MSNLSYGLISFILLLWILLGSPFGRKIVLAPFDLLILPYGLFLVGFFYREIKVLGKEEAALVYMNFKQIAFLLFAALLITGFIILLVMQRRGLTKENYFTNPRAVLLGKLIFFVVLIVVLTNYSYAIAYIIMYLLK